VRVAKKQLGLVDEDYRAILLRVAGVETSKDLDARGFEHVMQQMAALGFGSDFTKNFYGHRSGMATPAQLNFVRKLWDEYKNGEGGEFSLGKWMERTFKVSALRFTTKSQAQKAIIALKAMKTRRIANTTK